MTSPTEAPRTLSELNRLAEQIGARVVTNEALEFLTAAALPAQREPASEDAVAALAEAMFAECDPRHPKPDTVEEMKRHMAVETLDALAARGYRLVRATSLPEPHPGHSKHDDWWCECGLRVEDCDYLQENLSGSGLSEADRGAGLRLTEWEQAQLDAIRYRNQQAYIGVGPERLASIDVAWLLDRLDRALAASQPAEREEAGE